MNKRVMVGAAAMVAGAMALRHVGLREDIDWELAEKPGSVIELDGYRVHYIDRGAGPAIVLIHGFGGQTYSFRNILPILERDHRVIAVDLKGYGYSERDAGAGLSHTDQVAMLKALLEKLGVTHAVFVGHSMGGVIVQRFAAAHPEMVDALVLAASGTGEERFNRRLPPAILLRPILPVLARLTAQRLLTASYYDKSVLTADVRAEYNRPAHLIGSMNGLLAIMHDAAQDVPIDVSRITMPVLLLHGADDRIVPLRASQRIRERLPQARLIVLDRAGHMLLEERPQEAARAILDFLRDTAPARRASAPAAAG